MPAQLTADAVGDGGDKLSAQAELGTELQSKLLRRVLPLRHVPLELVHQRDVPNMDVQLGNNTAVNKLSYRHHEVAGCVALKQTDLSAASGVGVCHLDDDPLVRLVLQDAVCGIRFNLLPDGRGDGRDEGQRAEVQVVTEDLGKHLGRHQLFY